MKINIFFSISIILFITSSCSSNSESDLTVPTPDYVTYTKDIKDVIESNCIPCHTDPPINGAPMRLTTYDAVKEAITNRGLLDRISRAQGAPGMMPRNGNRLPQAKIDLIAKWQTDGFVE